MSNSTKNKKGKKLNNYELVIEQSHFKTLFLILKKD